MIYRLEFAYNLACLYARQNKIEESANRLKKALKKGLDDWKLLKSDPDLENIRGSELYQELTRDR